MTVGRMKKYITFLLIGIYDLAVAIVDIQIGTPFWKAMSITLAVMAGAMFMTAFYCFIEEDDEW